MRPYTFIVLLSPCVALVSPPSKPGAITKALLELPHRAVNFSSQSLKMRDEIDDWNDENIENRIAAWYLCPQPRTLYTIFNAMAVWQAFQRGVWYTQYPNEDRPRWGGIEYPHPFRYHAPHVDLGRADGDLWVFPLQPGPLGEWPGIDGAPVSGPPGDLRVVYDEHGMFAGVAVLLAGDPEGERLVWCYPIYHDRTREVGATAEGNSGVDEALQDQYYVRHFLYGFDPIGGSRPPSP
ncbi:hypothetical protein F4804DRAFT_348808 [Jackrogersella minutella]|nr:hypothetical protein F4804DRAFT_348808 [Jackrogersella minutella]